MKGYSINFCIVGGAMIFLFSCGQSKQDRVHAHILKAKEYIQKSDFQMADAELDKCLALDSGNAIVYYLKGNIESSRNNYAEAIALYTKSVELDSTYIQAYINRSKVWFYTGDNGKRCADLLKAEQLGAENIGELTKFCK